ncbi:hypothetical protein BJ912DRAFT_1059309 [Pholiota molesta]|nr:hypothetical protein BJ912DRAFT_1059309 [Pholiota molesta]
MRRAFDADVVGLTHLRLGIIRMEDEALGTGTTAVSQLDTDPLLTPANGDSRTTWLQRASIPWGLHPRNASPSLTRCHRRPTPVTDIKRRSIWKKTISLLRRSQRHPIRHPIGHLFRRSRTCTPSWRVWAEGLYRTYIGTSVGRITAGAGGALRESEGSCEWTRWPPVLFAADLRSQALINHNEGRPLTNSLRILWERVSPFIAADHALAIFQLITNSFLEGAVFEDRQLLQQLLETRPPAPRPAPHRDVER